ncbi:serine/threonine-protein phosphatase 6 regulatory ankyrin repeat subunit C-like [Phymastichus coffea]|uniref:serine/threonine-protein phosphatase 6 regulatory ankyrin repeat subunit C-like n=1 Tax=Phymastichus coffea TaxID=108790 RepID=UPI00273CEBDB|nr:serine/threonine-protein phosphatase 6 regulatory ankyrin repeat subunit C-like [Phymastichus coffea]
MILDKQGWPSSSEWSDYELLLKAIRGDCKCVAWVLLEKGARIFKRQRVDGPLHKVAMNVGWTDFAKILLERGANVAALNNKGDTSLHIAFAHNRSPELIDLLLWTHLRDTSAVKDVVNKEGLSFLHIACTRPNSNFISTLVEHGQVDVNIQVPIVSDSMYAGYTPLHFAVKFGRYDVVEHLLNHYEIDLYEQEANGSTPLHIATERGDIEMIDLILRYDDNRGDRCNRFGLSHFMAVCACSNETLVDDYLRVAVYRSWTEPTILVRSQVANQQHYSYAGYTPLHFAAQYGRVNTAKLLLQLGAECCLVAVDGATPLALASQRKHTDVCMLLNDCCTDTLGKPAEKKRRIFGSEGCVNVEFVHFNDDFRKCNGRSYSIANDESTSTTSSAASLSSKALVELFYDNPRTICVNSQQIAEVGNESCFYCLSDVRDNSVGFLADNSICRQGLWNLETYDEMDYTCIKIPEDVNLDFYEPLDDVDSDHIFYTFDKTVDDNDCFSMDNSTNVDVSLDNASDDNLAKDANECVLLTLSDQDKIFDSLFEQYLENENFTKSLDGCNDDTAADVDFVDFDSIDDEMMSEKLMHCLHQDADSSIIDFESSFANNRNDSPANFSNHEQREFGNTDDLDTTLEVSSSSSELDILTEDSEDSCFFDGSSIADTESSDNGVQIFKMDGVWTPLHLAVCKTGWSRIVKRLLEKGAKVSDRNDSAQTVLHVAFAHKAPNSLIDMLLTKYLEKCEDNLTDAENLSFLDIACTRPHIHFVKRLITEHYFALAHHRVAMFSEESYAGYTPIHFAVAYGQLEVAQYLLNISYSLIYLVDRTLSTPLHLAAQNRDIRMIDLIFQYDREQNVYVNSNGLTHFMIACMGSEGSVVQKYFDASDERRLMLSSYDLVSSRVEESDTYEGYTPLHFAAEFGRSVTIAILFHNGADCSIRTHSGLTVHDLAQDNVADIINNYCTIFGKCTQRILENQYDFMDLNGNDM